MIYDYLIALTKGKKLVPQNTLYNPILEFEDWFMSSGIEIEKNVFVGDRVIFIDGYTKKKSIFLPVSAPFHSSLMKPASEKMESKIKKAAFKNSNIDIVSNVLAASI